MQSSGASLFRVGEVPMFSVDASGGVTDMDCIKKLNAVKSSGIEGIIIGRALYERSINLAEAQAYIDQN